MILLQGCGHNPSGVDLNPAQWCKLSRIIKERQIFPIFDLTYQGMVSGDVDVDAFGVRQFARDGHRMAVIQSFSKNMGK